MKLTVQDAVKLLNTSERTLYRWIREGSIPYQRVDDRYRFHRAELLEWAMARGISIAEGPQSSLAPAAPLPGFAAALRAGGVHYEVPGTDRESLLRAIVSCMPLTEDDDRELLFDVMLAREALGATGVGEGIAIPHARAPVVLHTLEPSITLCFLANPVEFGAIDGRPVHTVFALITHTIRSHLDLLARLARALMEPGFKAAILERAPAEEILARAELVVPSIPPPPPPPERTELP